jgi:hypothetical protein
MWIMSPREKHIPDDAKKTTVGLTPEDSGAIRWISDSRRLRKDKRTTTNDILVDALWYFLEKNEGKTRDQIQAMIPVVPVDEHPKSKVTEMKLKSKR